MSVYGIVRPEVSALSEIGAVSPPAPPPPPPPPPVPITPVVQQSRNGGKSIVLYGIQIDSDTVTGITTIVGWIASSYLLIVWQDQLGAIQLQTQYNQTQAIQTLLQLNEAQGYGAMRLIDVSVEFAAT